MTDEARNEFSKEELAGQMEEALARGHGPKIARMALALVSGAVPFAGGVFGAAAGAWSEAEQEHWNKVFRSWLKLQEDELREIGITIAEILSRINLNDESVSLRIESPEYLSLLKKCFRDWAAAESEEKRVMVRNLLTAAAVYRICPDDVLRMFVQWIETYSEGHFKVMKFIYKHSGCTRAEIWAAVRGERVREDSSEADLFKLYIHDLSTGHVIRQHRETDYYGNFVKTQTRARTNQSGLMKSAFDHEKPYELTELGTQFVRYTVEGVMPSIAAPPSGASDTRHTAVD